MTPEEKQQFIISNRENLKNLAHAEEDNTNVTETKDMSIETTGTEASFQKKFENISIETTGTEASFQKKFEDKSDSSVGIMGTLANISSKPTNEAHPVIMLEPPHKKCPKGYIQHPRKSKKCVHIDDIKKSSKPKSQTKKVKSKIPEILTAEEIQSSVEEDISEEQHSIESDEISAKSETKSKEEPEKEKSPESEKTETPVKSDPEKQEYDQFRLNPDNTYPFLYPHLLDPDFNRKIAEKKEFSDFRYDGEIHDVNGKQKTQQDYLDSDYSFSSRFNTPYNNIQR
jgi:hypothetical protein